MIQEINTSLQCYYLTIPVKVNLYRGSILHSVTLTAYYVALLHTDIVQLHPFNHTA